MELRKTIWDSLERLVVCVGIMAAVLAAGYSLKTFAADSSVIENVTVTITDNYGEQEEILEPTIVVGGTGCSKGDVQYSIAYDKWKPGKKVRMDITVVADDGKVFPTSLNSTQCKVTGASFVSAKGLEDNKLQVKVDYKPVMVLGDTQKAGWSTSSGKRAVWRAVPHAPGYAVVLYGDNKVVKRLTVEGTSTDLSEYMKDNDKTYFYEVKAIPITSDQKKYLKEGGFVAADSHDYYGDHNDDEWNSNSSDGGSIKGNSYILPDGSKGINAWKKVYDNWYYFDQNGNMTKGWQFINGLWYYMDSRGVMKTGWVNPSGNNWFFLSDSGEMLTGWVQPGPLDWYYMDGSGYMQRGWIFVNGRWYYLGTDGKMQRGWVHLDGKWYYLGQNPDGAMMQGWVQISGAWYYFYNDGTMAVNTMIDGWHIGSNGALYQ